MFGASAGWRKISARQAYEQLRACVAQKALPRRGDMEGGLGGSVTSRRLADLNVSVALVKVQWKPVVAQYRGGM